MATLAEITAAERSGVLPGYVLSPPRLREWGAAESEAGATYLRTVRDGSAGTPPEVQAVIMQQALSMIADGEFGMGTPKLDAFLRSAAAAPFVTWLCLRVKHPQVGRDDVEGLVTPELEEPVIRAVLELWGFLPAGTSKKKQGAGRGRRSAPSTGPGSSPSSAPSGDSPATSAST